MKRKLTLLVIFVGFICSLLVIKPIYSKNSENIEQLMRIFSDAFVLVRENYVEEVDTRELIYGALKGMVETLDSYSQFMEPEDAKILEEDTEGKFGGLGIRITERDGYITVVSPLPETPAYELGIMPGDRIVEINGESAVGLTVREAVSKMRGEVGTDIKIGIKREDKDDLIEYEITRASIVPQKVYTRMMDNDIGYLRLVEFTKDSPKIMEEELNKLIEKGADSLIFDIRNNPGGLLSSAVETANIFIKRNELVVYTEGRRSDQTREFRTSRQPVSPDIPLVVLINKGSASGSEIVAGAIKDHARGIIIGETSFGKASVQSIIDLEDGSSLRLTTAQYFTPNGKKIHEQGIKPDILVSVTEDERRKIFEQQQKIYYPDEDEDEEEEKPGEKILDPQLARAHDLLMARKIFMRNSPKELHEEK